MVTLPHSAHRKHAILVQIKQMSKSNKYHLEINLPWDCYTTILGNRCNISFMAGDTANIWQDIELRIDIDPF